MGCRGHGFAKQCGLFVRSAVMASGDLELATATSRDGPSGVALAVHSRAPPLCAAYLSLTCRRSRHRSGILDQVGDDMDGTQSRLKMAQRKVQEIMRKTSGKAQCYIIIALCVVLAVLMLLTFM